MRRAQALQQQQARAAARSKDGQGGKAKQELHATLEHLAQAMRETGAVHKVAAADPGQGGRSLPIPGPGPSGMPGGMPGTMPSPLPQPPQGVHTLFHLCHMRACSQSPDRAGLVGNEWGAW